MYELIKKLCTAKGISPTRLCTEITGSKGNLPTWQKGNINPTSLIKIADYFSVSVDYLLGRTDEPNGYNNIKNVSTTVNGTQANVIHKNNEEDLSDIKNILSQLSVSNRHRAIADILDLLDEKYTKK